MTRAIAAASAAILLACAAGCVSEAPPRIELYATSGAPPARIVELSNAEAKHAIRVSAGVAFGAASWERCPRDPSAPPATEPAQPTLTIADPSVLDVRELLRTPQHREWVLFGVKAGATTVTIKGACATQTYEVTVVGQR